MGAVLEARVHSGVLDRQALDVEASIVIHGEVLLLFLVAWNFVETALRQQTSHPTNAVVPCIGQRRQAAEQGEYGSDMTAA